MEITAARSRTCARGQAREDECKAALSEAQDTEAAVKILARRPLRGRQEAGSIRRKGGPTFTRRQVGFL